MEFIVVTGASSGIGEAICYELAKKKNNLIIVARNRQLLIKLKQKLESYYLIDVMIMPYDLSEKTNLIKMHQDCQKFNVVGLVNNAGIGLYGNFNELTLEDEMNLINLNLISVHFLSKLFLKDFINQGSGRLLNVASTAAFQAGPLMASYYASKAYVLNLTEGIAEEIKDSYPNITISVLCPGPVETNFQKRASITMTNQYALSANKVAQYAVREWLKGKVLIIPGRSNRMLIFLNRFIPRKIGRQMIKKNQLKKQK